MQPQELHPNLQSVVTPTVSQPPVVTPSLSQPPASTQQVGPIALTDQLIAQENAQVYSFTHEPIKPSRVQMILDFVGQYKRALVIALVASVLMAFGGGIAFNKLRSYTKLATIRDTIVTDDNQGSSGGGSQGALGASEDTGSDEEAYDSEDGSDEDTWDESSDEGGYENEEFSDEDDVYAEDEYDDTSDESEDSDDDSAVDLSYIEEDSDDSAVDDENFIDNSTSETVDTPVPTPIPPKPAPTTTHKFTIASWNTNSDNAKNVGTEVLSLMTKSQIMGLQEIHKKTQRDSVKSKVTCTSCKYSGYIPSYTSDGASAASYPIVWDKAAFTAIGSGSSRKMCDSAKTTTYSYAARYATWVQLQSRVNGKKFYIISTHFMAGESSQGKPTSDTLLTGRYKTHMTNLTALITELKKANIPVYVTGTFNVDYRYDRTVRTSHFPYASLGATSVRSNWNYLNLSGISSTSGTIPTNNRLIDYVFSWQRSDVTPNATTISTSTHGSKHYAVYYTSTIN